ncbi:hypothetical protein V1503_24865 [Bacillus sp. SCS-151]|uniref:hypothetical protein n=1 Tax=Nanhaiella sioensis TaxID=3115293 RepID=UPI0039790975
MKAEEVLKQRKVRSDKKREIKPTIPVSLKDCIYRISYITDQPVKDIAEQICRSGVVSIKVMDHLSEKFRRNLHLKATYYIGDMSRPSLRRRSTKEQKSRITIKFHQTDYENIKKLAYALDITPSAATAHLLEATIKEHDFFGKFLKGYLERKLDDSRMAELKKVMKYINSNNPYDGEISWAEFIFYLYDSVKSSTMNVVDVVNNYLNKQK